MSNQKLRTIGEQYKKQKTSPYLYMILPYTNQGVEI